jgi:hypothetical protein
MTAAYTNDAILEQQVGTVQGGHNEYVLTVSIGDNQQWSQEGWAALEIGSDPLVYANCVASGVGAWETCTATYTVAPGDIGSEITIELGDGGVGSDIQKTSIQGDFTNVTVTAVPDGGSEISYLLLAGLCCFGAMFASRKQLADRA